MEIEFLKEFYDIGVFTQAEIQECLQNGLITATQYETICGQPYASDSSVAVG